MADLGALGGFDANNVDPQGDYELIPAGNYPAQIVASDMRSTKNGNGQFLYLELEISDGEYAGRKLYDRLNLINPNPQAVEIAKRQFSALCRATGVMVPKDSEELHFRPVVAVVKVRPAKGEYGASNDIATYKPVDGAAATSTTPAASGGAAKAAPKPWERGKSAV